MDVSNHFAHFVPFTSNSLYPIHRWYRYKEGFSKDLVHLLLGLFGGKRDRCLDPFGGSGTTALACQESGVACVSAEVNPFVHHVAVVKLRTSYRAKPFKAALRKVLRHAKADKTTSFPIPAMSTITKSDNRKKWLFRPNVLQSILSFRNAFELVPPLYADLFLVVLAGILPNVGNTTKDGKCVRYKTGWRDKRITKGDVICAFERRAEMFLEDVTLIQERSPRVSNASQCYRSDAMRRLAQMEPASVDCVITSPPYLNSFDYTDVYMPELWALGFVKSYADVRRLRLQTFCSHVQVKWAFERLAPTRSLSRLMRAISENGLWNSAIPDMIRGYFLQLTDLLTELKRVLRPDGRIAFVVGTSSYFNIPIQTDLLLIELAEGLGLQLVETRILRQFRQSTQQLAKNGSKGPSLRESLVVLRKARRRR